MNLNEQIEREQQMASRGESRAKSMIAKALDRGDAATTPAGVALAKRAIQPLSNAIRELVSTAKGGKAGRKHVSAVMLADVDPDLAAFITVRCALSGAGKGSSLKKTAMVLGDRLESEIIADSFEAENGALYRAVIRNAVSRGLAPERQAKSMMLANTKFEVVEKPWTPRERLLIGSRLIELLIETIGLIEMVHTKERATVTHMRLQFLPDIGEWFTKYNMAATLTRPLYLPTVIPPKPWTDVFDGAYYSPVVGRATILSRVIPGQLEALQAGDLSKVYRGLNGLQETPWRVNQRVLDVMTEAWEMDAGLTCLPRRADEEMPEMPQEVIDDVKGGLHRKAWRKMASRIHMRNASNRSARFELDRAMEIAKENLHRPIYFPHRLDFRGRAYASSTSLNPQGADEVRGLLEFHEGKALGDRGAFWLGVHGANLFGNDKVSLADREAWAVEHMAKAVAVAADPLGNLWWTEADKPWCFLAWCFEWASYAQYSDAYCGKHYVSHLPIALDGSCNGIQHFSAMLRDEVGGAAVNLVPAPKPNDIYQRVADRVIEKLKAHAELPMDENTWIVQGWLNFGINRKITKRPVMVLPYGGAFRSCSEYVAEAVNERILAGQENPFGENLHAATTVLASIVWSAMDDVVVGAREVMAWLQTCTKVAAKAGHPLRWTTPSGFVVVHHYRELSNKRIETKFCGSTVKFCSNETTDELDKSKQTSAVSPNFVHSMDASAMMLTIGACLDAGIASFAMIHDSYGTHAADTDTLAHILRREFVRMYLDHDVLTNFRDAVAATLTPEEAENLPPVPTPGKLDLLGVLESAYFFA